MEEKNKSIMDLPAIREFDAFPKTLKNYKKRTNRGGILTILIFFLILILIFFELNDFLFGEPSFSFNVDKFISHSLGINLDLTIAMPCHYLSVNIKDAVGDRMYMTQEFKKEGTTFDIGNAKRIDHGDEASGLSASEIVHASRRKSKSFGKTKPLIPEGPACRIYGNTLVKKVTGNLHITTLGHGYLSWEHTDHKLMNLSHVITEFSFGQFFPNIVQPLDNSVELTNHPFHIFQYFLSVVPTTYVDRSGRRLHTNQYSVTDMSRTTEEGKGIPGLFFKYDFEPMSLTVHERTTTLVQFLVRLAGMIGGIVVCSGWSFRILDRFVHKIAPKIINHDDDDDHHHHHTSGNYSPLPIVSPQVTGLHSLPTRRFHT